MAPATGREEPLGQPLHRPAAGSRLYRITRPRSGSVSCIGRAPMRPMTRSPPFSRRLSRVAPGVAYALRQRFGHRSTGMPPQATDSSRDPEEGGRWPITLVLECSGRLRPPTPEPCCHYGREGVAFNVIQPRSRIPITRPKPRATRKLRECCRIVGADGGVIVRQAITYLVLREPEPVLGQMTLEQLVGLSIDKGDQPIRPDRAADRGLAWLFKIGLGGFRHRIDEPHKSRVDRLYQIG